MGCVEWFRIEAIEMERNSNQLDEVKKDLLKAQLEVC